LLDCWRVINTIASDTDYVTNLLTSLYNLQFLGRSCAGEDYLRFFDPGLQDLIAELFSIFKRFDDHIAVNDNSIGLLEGLLWRET
jgi:hypothetical protein